MNKEQKYHVEAFLLALAFTGVIVGFGLGPIQASAYNDSETYTVPIMGLGIEWGHLYLHTQSYNDGSELGAVTTTQSSDAYYPLSITENGVGTTYINSQTKLAWGSFTVFSWILWYLPIYQQTIILYNEITYTHPGSFTYYKYWT